MRSPGAKRVEKYSLDFNTFFEVNFISKFLKNAVAKTIKLFKNRLNILVLFFSSNKSS